MVNKKNDILYQIHTQDEIEQIDGTIIGKMVRHALKVEKRKKEKEETIRRDKIRKEKYGKR